MHAARWENKNKTDNILHPKAETGRRVVFGLRGAGELLTLELEKIGQNEMQDCLCGMCRIQFQQRGRSIGDEDTHKSTNNVVLRLEVNILFCCCNAENLPTVGLTKVYRILSLSYLISVFLIKLQEWRTKITTLLRFNVL